MKEKPFKRTNFIQNSSSLGFSPQDLAPSPPITAVRLPGFTEPVSPPLLIRLILFVFIIASSYHYVNSKIMLLSVFLVFAYMVKDNIVNGIVINSGVI